MSFRCGAVILMVTSDALNPTLGRCRQLGIQRMQTFRYVVKPIRMEDLAEAIRQVLFMEQAPATAGETAGGWLKMLQPQASANGTTQKGKVGAPVTKGKSRSLGILLAEDSVDNRTLIEAYFKGTSHRLEMVENGELAVERFKRNTYDVVLMDIHMPVMDGYTATRKMREWERTSGQERTAVMALTASAQDEAIRQSLAAGCDDHLAKPIRRSVLLQAIEEVISRNNSAKDTGGETTAMPDGEGEGKLERNVVRIDADLSDLVPNFLEHKRDDVQKIAAAIEAGDYETLSQVGHKMKGEGGSYGFDAITMMGGALEEAAKIKDQAAVRHWASELTAFLETVEVVYA
jgi:CheY-like chemotaxis protein/HPt (histidine-containing phosphotransfer) domain-containing protein